MGRAVKYGSEIMRVLRTSPVSDPTEFHSMRKQAMEFFFLRD